MTLCICLRGTVDPNIDLVLQFHVALTGSPLSHQSPYFSKTRSASRRGPKNQRSERTVPGATMASDTSAS